MPTTLLTQSTIREAQTTPLPTPGQITLTERISRHVEIQHHAIHLISPPNKMGDKSLESEDVAVASTEPMSLFDEEILFDKDPNKAYFKYLVGIDQETVDDGTLNDDSGIKTEAQVEYQAPVDVQKKWIKMAGGTVASDADTLESLPRAPPRVLENISESVFGNVKIDKDFKRVTLPPVVYLGKELDKTPPEQAPEQAPTLPSTDKKTFFGRNRKALIVILVFFFLTTIGLTAAFLVFFASDREDPATSNGDELPTLEPTRPPTQKPKEQDGGAGSTPEPTASPTTVAPTLSPTKRPSVPPTASPTEEAQTTLPTFSPTPEPTGSPTLPFVLEELIAMLSAVSPDNGAALSDRTSPQFFAAQWLSKESSLTWYSDQTKIQRYVLATLFLSTKGYQWVNSAGWLTEQDECEWYSDDSVDVCNEFGEIERLYLPVNGLQGPIPSELSLLSNSLTRIYLSGNDLSGDLPTELALLTNLQWLSLKQNRNIQSVLPTELGQMTALTLLNLSELKLYGRIPAEIVSLTNLETLWLDDNSLGGTLPPQMGSMWGLKHLILNSNRFIGSVPSGLLQLPDLNILSLDHNNFTGTIDLGANDCFSIELSADCDEVACDCCDLCCYDGIGCA